MITLRNLSFMVAAVVATSGLARAGEAAAPAPQSKPAPTATANSTDLQQLKAQFGARRDALIAQREALVKQLKNATEEQRKAILEKMHAQQKDLIEAQRALGRQIRDEMRRLQPAAPTPGPGPGRR